MTANYQVIEVYIREDAHRHGKPLYEAIIELIRGQKIMARSMVTRGIAGCYENGEISTHTILDLSYHLPLKIEIILPETDLDKLYSAIEEMVDDGVVTVADKTVRSFRTSHPPKKHP